MAKAAASGPRARAMGAVSREMEKHGTSFHRGPVEVHRDQAIVERFNRILAERLFRHQYAVEMRLPKGEWSVAGQARLPRVVAALNNQTTRLTELKPADAIRGRSVFAQPVTLYSGSVDMAEQKLPLGAEVRHLFQPDELEGGHDGIFFLKVYSRSRLTV